MCDKARVKSPHLWAPSLVCRRCHKNNSHFLHPHPISPASSHSINSLSLRSIEINDLRYLIQNGIFVPLRHLHAQVKVLGVFYKGGKWATEEPRLLGTIENQLGIREWLESQGHTYVVTDDKEGENSTLDKEIVDAEIVITTPFHPGYITRERIQKAKKLKACITAGVGNFPSSILVAD